MSVFQSPPQYQPRYGFRYLKQRPPAPSIAPVNTITAPPPMEPTPPPAVSPTPQQAAHDSGGDENQHARQDTGPRYASFSDAFETISGGENRRLDQGYVPPGSTQGSAREGGGGGNFFSALNPFNRSAGENIGGALGQALIPIPVLGSAIGSAIGGSFDTAEEAPEVPETPAAPAAPTLTPQQQQARTAAIATNQQLQRERESDTDRTAAYAGTTRASGSSASSGGRGGRRGGGSSPSPRQNVVTDSRGNAVTDSSGRPVLQERREDSGGGGGGGGDSCFAKHTPFLMADGTLKGIDEIKVGDVMAHGGRVYGIMQGDGTGETWYDYLGVHVTGSHFVLEGRWIPVEDSQYAQPLVSGHDTWYCVLNEKHRMVAFNDVIFTDFDAVDSVNDELEERLNAKY